LAGGVEADEAEFPSGGEDAFEGDGIEEGVPFGMGRGGDVTGDAEGSSHPGEFADGEAEAGFVAESEGEVGKRAKGKDVDGGALAEAAFEEGGGGFVLRGDAGDGELAEETVGGGAPVGGEGGGALEGAGGADEDGDFGMVAVGEEAGDGFGSGGGVSEAVDGGDGLDLDIGALEEEEDGEEVVGAGVGIDDDATGLLRPKGKA